MLNRRFTISFIMSGLLGAVLLSGCSGAGGGSAAIVTDTVDTAVAGIAPPPPPRTPEPGDSDYTFTGDAEIREYVENGPCAARYRGGILPVIAREVPRYAARLVPALALYDRFIVVDKAAMEVILYDRYGHVERRYGMACAKNYGTKHRKADSRTPEGFFSVEGRYDSTDWLYTDDNGVQSKKKGQFGPRFIRIRIPNTSQIGIHGTCSPWSIGHRASHGCIRITNENILELVDLVTPGMPVIILPGRRDRAVNRMEGYDIPYFHTDPRYAMAESERALRPASRPDAGEAREDTLCGAANVPAPDDSTGSYGPADSVRIAPATPEKPDSVALE